MNQPGSFSNTIELEIANTQLNVVEYNRTSPESVLGTFVPELSDSRTNSEFSLSSNNFDPLIGGVVSVNPEFVLDLAVDNAKEQLESFANDAEFVDKMNLAFGDDWQPQAAYTLIQDLVTSEAMPKIEVVPSNQLKASGAFGEGTIYLSEKFLGENTSNPEAISSVVLEEIGHYLDQKLSSVDSPGDEGNIFARLVRDETIDAAELEELQAEDDSAIITLNGEVITIEQAAPPYPGYLLKYEPGAPLNYDVHVKEWQQRMHDRGWNIDVDGLYGSQSERICRQFQQEKGLAVDGIIGPQTWHESFRTDNVTSSSSPNPLKPPVLSGSPGTSVQKLLEVASSYVGIHEQGGNNRGPMVEEFQRAVDGTSEGEAWCMSFAQYCIKAAEVSANTDSKVAQSEHCLTVWNNSPSELKSSHPEPGSLVIWRYGSSTSGHVGIVEKVNSDGTFTTIEGNTSSGSGIDREGDGVYRKQRDLDGAGNMRLVGFLKVF